MSEIADKVSAERNVDIDFGPQTRAAPALMCPIVQAGLQDTAEYLKVQACLIVSGGGHDCAIFAGQGVLSGMIFIRNENGNYNPDEAIRFDDFACAVEVLTERVKCTLKG